MPGFGIAPPPRARRSRIADPMAFFGLQNILGESPQATGAKPPIPPLIPH
ncbi:hypothetical protein OB2597_16015 [Pseudooceanicola batsensis HTCC2597]|uniref:Uncharacterized protein n=1 Tax=Pseudooceanicola batsensis (strain ATCC BAA-863 / DSM 15984 / KCTC 12145 / HTCC2597) TaxID=252305 RepID=A3TZ85_PSEBH|nr:hypothetical protein OB2597_16015 [Pseudooceanicola batsensis HTCC2597]